MKDRINPNYSEGVQLILSLAEKKGEASEKEIEATFRNLDIGKLSDEELRALSSALAHLVEKSPQCKETSPSDARVNQFARNTLSEIDKLLHRPLKDRPLGELDELPNEIIQMVAGKLDMGSKKALSQTSKVMRDQVNATVEDVTFSREHCEAMKDPENLRVFLETYPRAKKIRLDFSHIKLTAEHFKILKDHAKKLVELHLSGGCEPEATIEFLSSGVAENLVTLHCGYYSSAGNDIAAAISNYYPKLEVLDLSGSGIGDQGLIALVGGSWPKLRELNLYNSSGSMERGDPDTSITEVGVTSLANAKWPELRKLNMGYQSIGNIGAGVIAGAAWPHLTELCLDSNNLEGDVGVRALTRANWPELTRLSITNTDLDANGGVALAQGNWPKLTYLFLGGTEILDTGAIALAEANWPELKELYLGTCGITDLSMGAFANANWPKLETLHITWNSITDAGVETLSAGNWPNLTKLGIFHGLEHGPTLGDASLIAISTSNWSLKETDLFNRQFISPESRPPEDYSPEAKATFLNAFPEVKIPEDDGF